MSIERVQEFMEFVRCVRVHQGHALIGGGVQDVHGSGESAERAGVRNR
jgi:hypothetical protein